MDDEEIADERHRLLDSWEAASAGWGRQADRTRSHAMPVAIWLVDHADPKPGERVLELAAGPGDTGFVAAQRLGPDGLLISSDGTEGMLAVARERAKDQGVENVEFKQLQLEWIDMPTADVDVILCRWGIMLTVDPAAALQECRRVLKPGGRLAMAVWNVPEKNPWAMVPMKTLISLGHAQPPPPGGPGMFALSRPGHLQEMLEAAGFTDISVDEVAITRSYGSITDMLGETVDLSQNFGNVWKQLDDDHRAAVRERLEEFAQPFADQTGTVTFPGNTLVAIASA